MQYKFLINHLQRWRQSKQNHLDDPTLMAIPAGAEIFSDEQMERYGRVLAQTHSLSHERTEGVLLKRLANAKAILVRTHHMLTEAAAARHHVTPAGEWLLDNFYLIEEHVRVIKRHLPKGYEKGLPQLRGGFLQRRYPRIYDIALQIIEHGDGRWEPENLSRFIDAYQSVSQLTLGELWALPIMLRLALIENLSRVCRVILSNWHNHLAATQWSDRMVEMAVADPKKLVLVIADMVRSEPPMNGTFVAELTRRLQSAALALPLSWIEQKLAEEGTTIELKVQAENTQQAANQATVSNSIAGLRRLAEIDWRQVVEKMSVVEQVLKKDPTETYGGMDFITRDRYRHVVEQLARESRRPELEVAAAAVQLATAESQNGQSRRSHVGYYLIDAGLVQLQHLLGMKVTPPRKNWALPIYFGAFLVITLAFTALIITEAHEARISTGWRILLGLIILLCTAQVAVALVNWLATLWIKPHPLPRMDFNQGIPPDCRTLVAVPALISSEMEIESLVEALEVRFLGNRDLHLHFALVTDFNDAPQETMPDDAAMLTSAAAQIAELNHRYRREGGDEDIFFLFHRPRRWNPREGVWMGYERKRGKLNDLNALLREHATAAFKLIVGRTEVLASVKYVITLDSDTQLPRDSARQYIGAMAHPLNRPCYDSTCGRVTAGYGILQPRIAEALPTPGPTLYVWLCTGELGIDPYTRTVSNVYQDVFGEGSFTGKGIYDVALFHEVLSKRFPPDQILSHDLLEGCYLRSGFLSDVPLYENSPGSYLTDVKRRRRWIRGDWQITAWLFKGGLSALSKWKIFDNLRRSLTPVGLMALLILMWTILPATGFWLSVILGLLLLPEVVSSLLELTRKPEDMRFSQHATGMGQILQRRACQLLFYLACLPHEAWYSLEAIVRTGWRQLVSRRHLLEWTPSTQIDHGFHNRWIEWLMQMAVGPILAVFFTFILLWNGRIGSLLLSAPLLILWLISPFLARTISQPYKPAAPKLDANQVRFLHRMARKTWGFFDTFVTAEDHWLPPDNYQEAPREVLCHRTSPTNMGLALLANVSAYDFGYINSAQLLQRTQDTLKTMLQLERYRGHFYNWYDTQTLEALQPRYVSTVDGGNLAGHLLTLRQGLLGLIDEPLLRSEYLQGIEDTLDVLAETVAEPHPDLFSQFRHLLAEARLAFNSWAGALAATEKLCDVADHIASMLMHEWPQKLLLQCHVLRDELKAFSEVSPAIENGATLRDLASRSEPARLRLELAQSLAVQAFELAQMDVSFLYNATNRLMTIGFNVEKQQRDRSDYDLLSSEARLASFVAIAQGQVPQENWFALGRLQVMSRRGQPVMMSWSGSMFEYLMPLLVMPSYPGTLLDHVCRAAVGRHIDYGVQRGVPWGVSESGFHSVDVHSIYQYRAFGVPDLGFKRGLEEDLVVAPYATVMALMVEPEAACLNLQRLAAVGAAGRFGFYEAIDFTPTRLPRNRTHMLVRSFMVHHQGMSLLAFSYLLHDQPMQRRFAADALFQSTLLLLQERIPKPVAAYFQKPKSYGAVPSTPSHAEPSTRVFHHPNTRSPQVQLLSNGRYHVMLTQAGGGYSRWKEIAVTRWREDPTCDNWGLFTYLTDVKTGAFWSTSFQPTGGSAKNFKAAFSEAHAEFNRTEHDIEVHTEIVVSPEDDIELRRSRIRNLSKSRRVLEFTSYAEVVLAAQGEDLSQPAFSNLFVETELLRSQQAILVTRRPRSQDQATPWLCHLLNVYSEKSAHFSFETSRDIFIGRDGSTQQPAAMARPGALSNSAGTVLDPVISIRCRITLDPGATITLDLITGVTDSRDHCLTLVEKYHDRHLADRIFGLTWTHSQVLLHQLDISEADAQLYAKLAGAILYASRPRRAEPGIIASNRYGQSKLWGYSISGDLPIVLLEVSDVANIEIVKQLVQAQNYWRRKGLWVDVVILNEEVAGYRQTLQDQVMSLINARTATAAVQPGGAIFVRMAEQVPPEDRILLQSVARLVLSDKRGTLKEQISRRPLMPLAMPALRISKPQRYVPAHKLPLPTDLLFFNGYGGFSPDGEEYLIGLVENKPTPAPWVNIIANPEFGTLVSASGQGYTWSENSHEFRLTPWENDPVQDRGGEAFYLRDEETGRYWSTTALPCRGCGDYRTRHGFGYSVFEHLEEGIYSEMWVTVAADAPVKFVILKIHNDSRRRRRVSITGYIEWVLGDLRTKQAAQIITGLSYNGGLTAQNHYNAEFSGRTAFFEAATSRLGLNGRTVTGSRTEFIGRNRTLRNPAALERARLSGRAGAGFDPCGAIQLSFDLEEGHSREVVFTLGCGKDAGEAEALMQRYRGVTAATDALVAVRQYWRGMLNAVKVSTPDPAVDLLVNGWLVYQVLSSRLWGRTGFYQSSGAFGFRDQLQDVMALVHTRPDLLRQQLLLCASRQFVEGDVQHWWHPPQGRGVRTRCSDDYLWLPYALCRYVETTGDLSILDERVSFLQSRPLKADEESNYELPGVAEEQASVYQHAVRAIVHGLRYGQQGLPLMGSGDWNDGMNLVGIHGRGESVWLGFFLYTVLKLFAQLSSQYGDKAFALRCETEREVLRQHLEQNAWDGEWYRRAYFDDGTPLGSANNTECRIDSIAQSWSVLSGAGEPGRAKQAMAALERYLVRPQDRLVALLSPPFNTSALNPGYIKGYVPGIRENGGQYTHAAVWAAMAFAELGDSEEAWRVFNLINPLNHGKTPEQIATYRIEPYVVAGDVYSVAPHTGSGGWSWYTGSAGWMYRLMVESLLGVYLENGDRLRLSPHLPADWEAFTIEYRFVETLYRIQVSHGTEWEISLDDITQPGQTIQLVDDRKPHVIKLTTPSLRGA